MALLDSLDSGCLQGPPGKEKLGCGSRPLSRNGHLRYNLSKPAYFAMVLFVLKTYSAFPKALDPYLLAKVFLFVCLITGIILVA